MCEIFPEVKSCCLCCSLRVGLLFICILSICTGTVLVNVTLKTANHTLAKTIEASMKTKDFNSAVANSVSHALTIACAMGFLYMICGFILFWANMFDEEGYVQIFVWLTFLNVVCGLLGIIFMSVQCTITTCALSKLDWLTASFLLVFSTAYLGLWIYFISVANSYIVEKGG